MAREYRIDVVVDAAQAVEGARQFNAVMEDLGESADVASKKLDRYLSKQTQFARQLDESSLSVFSYRDVSEQLHDTLRAGSKLVDSYATEIASLAVQFRDAASAGTEFISVLAEIRDAQATPLKLPGGGATALEDVKIKPPDIDTSDLRQTLKTSIDKTIKDVTKDQTTSMDLTVDTTVKKVDTKPVNEFVEKYRKETEEILKSFGPMQLLMDIEHDFRQMKSWQPLPVEQVFEVQGKISDDSLTEVDRQLDLQLGSVTEKDRAAIPIEQEYQPQGVVGESNLTEVSTELDTTLGKVTQDRPAIAFDQQYALTGTVDETGLIHVTEVLDATASKVAEDRPALPVEQPYEVRGEITNDNLSQVSEQLDQRLTPEERPAIAIEQSYAPTGVVDDSGLSTVKSEVDRSLQGAVEDRPAIEVEQTYLPTGTVDDGGLTTVDADVGNALQDAVKDRPAIPVEQVFAPKGVIDDSGMADVNEDVGKALSGAVQERPAIAVEQEYLPRGVVGDDNIADVSAELDTKLSGAVQDRSAIEIEQVYAAKGVVDDSGLDGIKEDVDSSLTGVVEDRTVIPIEQVYAPRGIVDDQGLADVDREVDEALQEAVQGRTSLPIEQVYAPTGIIDDAGLSQLDSDLDAALAVPERAPLPVQQVYAPLGTVDPAGLAEVDQEITESLQESVQSRPVLTVEQVFAPTGVIDDSGLAQVTTDLDTSLSAAVTERPALPVEQVYAPHGTVDAAGLQDVDSQLTESLQDAVVERPALPIKQVYAPTGVVDEAGLAQLDTEVDEAFESAVKDRPVIPVEQVYQPLGRVDEDGLQQVDAQVDEAFEGVVKSRAALPVEQIYAPRGVVDDAGLADVDRDIDESLQEAVHGRAAIPITQIYAPSGIVEDEGLTQLESDLDTVLAVEDRAVIPVEQVYAPQGTVDAAGMAGLEQDLDESLQVTDRPALTVEQTYLPTGVVDERELSTVNTELDSALAEAVKDRTAIPVEQVYEPQGVVEDRGLATVDSELDSALQGVVRERPAIDVTQVYAPLGTVDPGGLAQVSEDVEDAFEGAVGTHPAITVEQVYLPRATVEDAGLVEVKQELDAALAISDRPALSVEQVYLPKGTVDDRELAGVSEEIDTALQAVAVDRSVIPVTVTYSAQGEVEDGDLAGITQQLDQSFEDAAADRPTIDIEQVYTATGRVDDSDLSTVTVTLLDAVQQPVEDLPEITFGVTYLPEATVPTDDLQTELVRPLTAAGLGLPSIPVTITYEPETIVATETVQPALTEALQQEATLPALPVEASFTATATVDTTQVKAALAAPLEAEAKDIEELEAPVKVHYRLSLCDDMGDLRAKITQMLNELVETGGEELTVPAKVHYQLTLEGTDQAATLVADGLAPLTEERELDVPVTLHPGAEVPTSDLLGMLGKLTDTLQEATDDLPPTSFEAAMDPLIKVAPLPGEAVAGPLQESIEAAGPIPPVEVPVPVNASPEGLQEAGAKLKDAVEGQIGQVRDQLQLFADQATPTFTATADAVGTLTGQLTTVAPAAQQATEATTGLSSAVDKVTVSIEDGFSGAQVSVQEFVATITQAGASTSQFSEMLRQDMIKVLGSMEQATLTAEQLKATFDQLLVGRVSSELKTLEDGLKELGKTGEITREQITGITKVIDDMIEAASGAGNLALVDLLKAARDETMKTIDSLTVLGEAEDTQTERLKRMVQASFERIAAQRAEVDQQKELTEQMEMFAGAADKNIDSVDRMTGSYDEFTSRQALLQDMLAGEAQGLDDITERRAELNEQYRDGLVPLEEYIELTRIVDLQEKDVIDATEERTRSLDRLSQKLDPVGTALKQLVEDEKKWVEAMKAGGIEQEAYARGLENIAKRAEELKGKLPPPGGPPGGPAGPGGGGPPLTPITVMGELGGAFAGAVGVGFGVGAIKEAIEAASEYEVLLTKVQTSTHATEEETAKFRQGIEDLSEAFINSNIEEANAALQILASGYHDTADAVRILAAANELADITFGDLARTADTLASIMSAFELKAGVAVTAMQTLAVASHGSTEELQSLATFAGRMGAEFKAAGLSLEDFAAASATLKEAGGETRRTLAGMQQLIQKLASTTPEVAGRFKEWGIEVSRTRLENEGLLPVLKDLMEATGGNEQVLAHLLGSQQAAITVMKLMREEGSSLAENYRNIANAQELAAEAAERARETFNHQAEDLQSGLLNRMRELGEVIKDLLLPIITRLNEHIDATFAALATAGALTAAIVSFKLLNKVLGGQLIPTLVAFPKAFQTAGIAMKTLNVEMKAAATSAGFLGTSSRLAAVGVTGLTTAVRGLWLAFGPLGLLVTAATLLLTMAGNAKKAATDLATLRAETDALADSVGNMTRVQLAEQRTAAEAGLAKAKTTLEELQEQQRALQEKANAPLKATVGGGMVQDFTSQLDAMAAKVLVAERAVTLYGDQITMVDQTLDSSRRQVRGLRGDMEGTTIATNNLTAADLALGEQLKESDPFLKNAKRMQELLDLRTKLQENVSLPPQVRADELAAVNRELESLNVQTAQLGQRKGEMQAFFESIVSKVNETAAALFAYKDRLRDINLALSMHGVSQEQAADAVELARLAYVGAANSLNPLIQIAVKYSSEQIKIAAAVREQSITQEMANEQLAVAKMAYVTAGQSANQYREEVQKITDVLDPVSAAEREHAELLERVAALLGDEHPTYLAFKAKQEVALTKTVALLKLEEDGLVALAAQYDPLIANELARTKALIDARAVIDGLRLSEAERLEAMQQFEKVIDQTYDRQADVITQQAGLAEVWRVAWEEAIKRIDTQFVDLWKSAFKSFDSFKETLKDSFKQLLAELAHAAITRPILIGIAAKMTNQPKPGEVFEGPLGEKIFDLIRGRGEAARKGTEFNSDVVKDGTYAALQKAGLTKGQGGLLSEVGDVFGGGDPISAVFDKLSQPFDRISDTIGFTMEDTADQLQSAAQAIEASSGSFEDWISKQDVTGLGSTMLGRNPLTRPTTAAGVAATGGMTAIEAAAGTGGQQVVDAAGGLGSLLSGGLTKLSGVFGTFMTSMQTMMTQFITSGAHLTAGGAGAILGSPTAGGLGAVAGQAVAGGGLGLLSGTVLDQIMGSRGRESTTQILSGIGGVIGSIFGPLGSLAGGAIGSFVSNVIGGGKKLKDSFIELSVTSGELSGSTVQIIKEYKSFFRSRTRRKEEELDPQIVSALQEQIDNTSDFLRDMAESLGVATDAIDNFSAEPIKIQTKGKTEEEIQAELEQAMLDLAAQQVDDFLHQTEGLTDRFKLMVQILKDVNGVTEEFLRGFQIAAALEELMNLDVEEEAAKRLEAPKPLIIQIDELQRAAIEAAAEFDGSVESLEELTTAYGLAKEAMIEYRVLLQQVSDDIQNMFADTAQSIRESLMTPEELYRYRDALVDQQTALLSQTTDPEEILALSQSINALVGEMFNSLEESQRSLMGQGFLDYLAEIDELAQGQLAQAEGELPGRWGGFEEQFAGSLNEAMAEFYNAQAISAEAIDQHVQGIGMFGNFVSQFGGSIQVLQAAIRAMTGSAGTASAYASAPSLTATVTPPSSRQSTFRYGNEVNA